MTYKVLDIGAGSLSFGKDLVRLNPKICMLVLCGEPAWGFGPLFRPLSSKNILRMLKSDTSGVKRILSRFSDFDLPDNSLDMVTLNSPHPFDFLGVTSMQLEVERCLKHGGLFFSSYTKIDCGMMSQDFEMITEGRWKDPGESVQIECELPTGTPTRFPQSFTTRVNIKEHRYGNPRSLGSSYLYFDGISPGWKLWRKL